jgi:hypothetical protein
LPYRSGIRDISDGYERRSVGRGVTAQDYIQGDFWIQMESEEGEVIGEGGRSGFEDCEGSEGFFGDCAEETELVGGGDEGLEGCVELLGS